MLNITANTIQASTPKEKSYFTRASEFKGFTLRVFTSGKKRSWLNYVIAVLDDSNHLKTFIKG